MSQPLLSRDEESMHADDDSGVFDKTGVQPSTSTIDMSDQHELNEIEEDEKEVENEPVIIFEEVTPSKPEHEVIHIPNPLTRLINHPDPPYNKLQEFEADASADSGLVSDADLCMISGS